MTWTGGPFVASNPAACSGLTADPTCDVFILRVDPKVQNVVVAIAPGSGFESDDYDLFVHDPQTGALIASDADSDGYESVVFANTLAAYEVRVQPWTVSVNSTYRGVAERSRMDPPFDDTEQDCLEPIPDQVSVDLGQRVLLDVMLLLDGVDASVAAALMQNAARSYDPRNIELRVVGTRKVRFTSLESANLIDEAKAFVGGERPAGVDIVGVLTTKEMQGGAVPGSIVVGQADCIGGIRYPARSFFVASDIRDIEVPGGTASGPLYELGFNQNFGAATEVISHEIGHLMGAHHHYSNCVEGNLTNDGPGDFSPCTLMHPAVNNAGLQFGNLEGVVVRGHAVGYAAP